MRGVAPSFTLGFSVQFPRPLGIPLNPLGLLMQIYYFRSDKTLKINVVKLFLVRGFNLCKKYVVVLLCAGRVPRCLRRHRLNERECRKN
jgi:hypothetical protein